MPLFDLENLNPGTRFFFNDEEEKEGWVDIRALTVEKSNEIDKKTITKKSKVKRGQLFEESIVKDALRNKLTWDYVIVDWLVLDKNKKPVECTVENKVMMMSKSVYFASFVADKLGELSEQDDEKGKAEGEN